MRFTYMLASALYIYMVTKYRAWCIRWSKYTVSQKNCEVGVIGTVLLRVYSRTIFAIFIEIGLYLTDKEQKISWHSFF